MNHTYLTSVKIIIVIASLGLYNNNQIITTITEWIRCTTGEVRVTQTLNFCEDSRRI